MLPAGEKHKLRYNADSTTGLFQSPINRLPPTCGYQGHTCGRPRLDGYEFCIRHIQEDKSAPFKQCNYVYNSNGRRCIMPAPRIDKRDLGLCAEHMRKTQLSRQKSSRRHNPPPTTETLLHSLSHYSKPENRALADDLPSLRDTNDDDDVSGGKDSEEFPDVITHAPNPFAEIDAPKVNSDTSRVLDYASESDSDVEAATYGGTWRGADLESSDAESIDGSLEEEPSRSAVFRNCGIHTLEEVAQLTEEKLTRLRSLYVDQLGRLNHVLKERRRKYLHSLKKEKETHCNIYNQPKDSVREQKLYQKLKALNRYKKLNGVEGILHKKHMERRAMATEGVTVRQGPMAKCIFTEGGVKCGQKTVPMVKYCMKHILEDPNQLLFRACGCIKASFVCREPVPVVFENTFCVYHKSMPPAPPHLSASHVKAEDDAREQSASKSVAVRMVGVEKTKAEKKENTEGDPLESFNSEASTTDTASNNGSLENMEEC